MPEYRELTVPEGFSTKVFFRVARTIFFALSGLFLLAVALTGGAYLYVAPSLPSVADLKNIRLQTPLRVYTRNGRLIGEFGEQRRIPVAMAQVPPRMVDAFLASEDDRFFEHPGVDYEGLLRAAVKLVETGEKKQGGSTITMQLARNYFLTSERTYERKLKEIFLALLIEQRFGKDEILELYLNKIFLGHRAYGVGAAAEVYYGVDVQDLELAQIAMIAGLPKAPSIYNPLSNPALALKRRDYVLDRMLELEKITPAEHAAAVGRGVTAKWRPAEVEVEASYVAEMARREVVETFGEDEAYTGGYEVYTTIDGGLQAAADRAVRKALVEYDMRHGYRGPEARLGSGVVVGEDAAVKALEGFRELGGLLPAVVTEVRKSTFSAVVKNGESLVLGSSAYSWARRYIDHDRRGVSPDEAGDVVSAGDVVRVSKGKDGWKLRQLPEVGGALVALDAAAGEIISLSGGFDFALSKFNRAVQARRQPGSSFKPFIYSAALARGYTPATIVNDSPVVFTDIRTSLDWRPANYSGKFFGPTRLRDALKYSRNLVSIRLVDDISVRNTLDYILRFGFERADQPYNLTLALGSGTVTPLNLASAFTVFANGGSQAEPYLIDEIRAGGEPVYKAEPPAVCAEDCNPETSDALDLAAGLDAASTQTRPPGYLERTIPSDVAYQINSMLRDVIRGGTGRRARVLKRSDLAGKTGTTNDQRDAWFSGFNRDVVCTTWVGFDDHSPLGRYETGSRAALPMWIEFMKTALANKSERPYFKPPNVVTARIDPKTGLLAHPRAEDAIVETFRSEYLPKEVAGVSSSASGEEQKPIEKIF